MNYKEARALAELVVAAAPWAEDIYALPLRPAEQKFPRGPYMVSLSSEYLRAEFYSLQDWLAMVQQLEPTPGPTGLPLLEQRRFEAWVRDQLARTDLDDRAQRCSTKDLSLFAHRPYLDTLSIEVPFTVTIAPAVDSGGITAQDSRLPTLPEIMLTVKWSCPICGHALALSRQLPTWLDVRISLPGPPHTAPDSEVVCPADTWVVLESDEDAESVEGDPPSSSRPGRSPIPPRPFAHRKKIDHKLH